MTAIIVPDIKDPAIVCQGECDHRDCASLRGEWTGATCTLCGLPMAAGQRFYSDPLEEPPKHTHARCLEEKIQREQFAGSKDNLH